MDFKNEMNSSLNDENLLFEIYDLSFIELITINQVTQFAKPILRFDLYKLINNTVKQHKKLSTSSFYNTLKKLVARGFLEFRESKDVNYRKAIEVFHTDRAEKIVGFMFYFMINTSLQNLYDMDFRKEIQNLTSRDNFESSIIIEPLTNSSSDLLTSIIPMALDTFKTIARMSKATFLVSTEQLFQEYLNMGISDLNLSKIMNDGVIREPNNYFDLIVFPLYKHNLNFMGLTFDQILSEAKRLLIKDGFLLVIHLEDIPKTDHYYVNIFKNKLVDSGFFNAYNSDEVHKKLEKIGLSDVRSKTQNGINFIVAQNVSKMK